MMEDGNVTPSERSKNEEIIIPPNSALPDFQQQQPMSNKVLAAQGRWEEECFERGSPLIFSKSQTIFEVKFNSFEDTI